MGTKVRRRATTTTLDVPEGVEGEEVRLRLTGLTPLLLHNVQMADPNNEYVRQVKELTGLKRGKSLAEDEYEVQKARLQFLGSLYWDDTIGVYLPGFNILRSIMEGGTRSGRGVGQKVDGAVLDYTDKCAIKPWSAQYNNGDEILAAGHYLATMVRVPPRTGSRVMATRPEFTQWEVEFAAFIDTEVLSADEFVRIAQLAGKVIGVGDGRLKGFRRGRYLVDVA